MTADDMNGAIEKHALEDSPCGHDVLVADDNLDDKNNQLVKKESIEAKFMRLRNEWKSQRRHESSTMKMVTLPAYQKIIGIGPAAVPLLLRELETNLDAWFWALMAITEAEPVTESIRGDGDAMRQAWLDWARNRGIRW